MQKNISYGEGANILDLYIPAKAAAGKPVVIFFHGGFWQSGNRHDYAFLGQTLASRGILTLIADYRLDAQTLFPKFIEEGADAFAWARHNIGDYGGDPKRIFVMGHSAGAYIATMLALDPSYLAKEGLAPSNIAGVIGIAGLYDFLPLEGKAYARFFTGASPAMTQPISFASHTAPPLLLLSGDRDEKVDASNTLSLASHVHDKGGVARVVIYPQTGHIGILLPFTPLFHGPSTIVEDVTGFIKG